MKDLYKNHAVVDKYIIHKGVFSIYVITLHV